MFESFVLKYHDELKNIALGARLLSMDSVLKAKSGHCGLPLGGAEIGTFLYFACMNYDNRNLNWFDRDRFVLSAGHGSALQYALMHFASFGLSIDDMKAFRQLNSLTPGHPEYGHTPGIEYTTGPLGQGIAGAVGMALAERMVAARLNTDNKEIVDHRTFVIAGDGCMMEGVSGEACSFAGHLKLSRLIVFYDANNITIDGTIDLAFSENVAKRYEAYGWNVLHADGNDFISLAQAMDKTWQNSSLPNGQGAPTLIVCKTVAGMGSPKWAGKPKIHGNPMSLDDVNEAKKHLGIEDTTSFFVPQKCYEASEKLLKYRIQKSKTSNDDVWKTFESKNPKHFEFDENDLKVTHAKMATRVASGKALVALSEKFPNLVGGSADLAGSNNTTIPNTSFVSAHDFGGRNIHFGVREHAMAAICNGLTVHGGLHAYCATFAVFADYMRPAIRIAALMNIPTIFIFTHDSFAVGEDGPTHQPIEQMAALRSIPNLNVYRPADALETFLAWEAVMQKKENPSCFLLTRQDVNDLNVTDISKVRKAMNIGAYILKDFSSNDSKRKKIVLFASGSEADIALKSAPLLEEKFDVRVVSIPNLKTFLQHPKELNAMLPEDLALIGIEAGCRQNFAEICGRQGHIFGIDHFGLSAPYSILAEELGFTPQKFAQYVLSVLQKT